MPVYAYQLINADGSDGAVFEIEQHADDPPLAAHPLTGQAARRVYLAPHLAGAYHERKVNAHLKDGEHLAKLGFTRYERDKISGEYHKTAGKDTRAPESFSVGKEL
ncbi:MAG: zinc ribbon domain-containing protein [Puniceicoccales bacterium]|nr:zinc ribbon domain-containing protein [Puniceicoccales bacterium]